LFVGHFRELETAIWEDQLKVFERPFEGRFIGEFKRSLKGL